MSHFSIFSFETLKLDRKVPAALLLSLALLLAVEFGLARQDWVWGWIAQSPSGIFDAIEQQLIIPARDPAVIIMGSSRVQGAAGPRILEQALDLPNGSVLNLAMTSGRPFDALMLYERNRDKLSKARVLVFEVAEFQFNGGFSPSERERRFATLDQRLSLYDSRNTLDMTVGWVWRTYDAQGPLRRLLKSAVSPPITELKITEDGCVDWRTETLERGPLDYDVAPEVKSMYHRFSLSQARVDNLRRLIELAQADGLKVILIQTPVRDTFVDLVNASHAEQYASYVQATDNLTPGLPVQRWWRASELGIAPTDYYDYGHLTRSGTRIFTLALADRLKTLAPEALRPPSPSP